MPNDWWATFFLCNSVFRFVRFVTLRFESIYFNFDHFDFYLLSGIHHINQYPVFVFAFFSLNFNWNRWNIFLNVCVILWLLYSFLWILIHDAAVYTGCNTGNKLCVKGFYGRKSFKKFQIKLKWEKWLKNEWSSRFDLVVFNASRSYSPSFSEKNSKPMLLHSDAQITMHKYFTYEMRHSKSLNLSFRLIPSFVVSQSSSNLFHSRWMSVCIFINQHGSIEFECKTPNAANANFENNDHDSSSKANVWRPCSRILKSLIILLIVFGLLFSLSL